MIPSRIGMMGLMGAMLAGGMLVRDNGLSASAQPAQTNTAPPDEPVVESRQVRRSRERREAKLRRHRGY